MSIALSPLPGAAPRRDPAIAFIFPVLFPLFMIGLFSQVYRDVARVPGFPVP